MSKKKKEKKFTLQAAALSAVGIAGTVLWQKKDLLKAVIQLRQYPEGWVLIEKEPEVFLTKISEASKKNLFAYLDKSPWRLVDQVADGFFWMNQQEEILLLTQKKVLNDYWSWTASRPFFTSTIPAEKVEEPVETFVETEEYEYDLTEESQRAEAEVEQVAEAEQVIEPEVPQETAQNIESETSQEAGTEEAEHEPETK